MSPASPGPSLPRPVRSITRYLSDLTALYGSQQLSQDEPSDPATQGFVDPLIEQLHRTGDMPSGMITDLADYTAQQLLSGYLEGYETPLFGPSWTEQDNALLTRTRHNFFAFSGAKTYAQMREMAAAVYDAEGNIVPWDQYRRRALQINSRYNLTYLEAERQAVIAAGTQGSRWVEIEATRSTHPYLEYVTARDSHVREEHRPLDGIVLPVDDPFWDAYYPPNGWRCRCTTRRLTARQADRMKKIDSETAQKIGGRATTKMWRRNVGTSEVFSPDAHPYFRASERAKISQLSAVKDYGMPSVERIYSRPSRLSQYRKGLDGVEQYTRYWQQMATRHPAADGDGFTLIDSSRKVMAHFDNALRQKIEQRGRWDYFDEAARIFEQPDEVWGIEKSGDRHFNNEYFIAYIRYYQDSPVLLIVNASGRVDSFYRWGNGNDLRNFEDWRKGVLLYKKR